MCHIGGICWIFNRQFKVERPNAFWLSSLTYVATWTGSAYVAFIIDAYARRIVGWRASRTAHASFVLDALEQSRQRSGRNHQRTLQDRGHPSAQAVAVFQAVEFAALEWVDWFNNRRLLEPIGNVPPAEAEERYYAMLEHPAMAA